MLNSFFQGFKVPVKFYWDAMYDNILLARTTYSELTINYWWNYVYGRWYWWFLLFWFIFPLVIWWKYTDRSRFLEINLFGLVVSISAGILDTVGVMIGLWTYPYQLLPILPNFFPIDYIVIPVVFMFVYQKYSDWKKFIIANIIVASFLSLILDPIMVAINLYQPLRWQYYQSVPVFVFMVCFAKWVTMAITIRDPHYR